MICPTDNYSNIKQIRSGVKPQLRDLQFDRLFIEGNWNIKNAFSFLSSIIILVALGGKFI